MYTNVEVSLGNRDTSIEATKKTNSANKKIQTFFLIRNTFTRCLTTTPHTTNVVFQFFLNIWNDIKSNKYNNSGELAVHCFEHTAHAF